MARIAAFSLALTMVGLFGGLLLSAGRWSRSAARRKSNRHVTNAMLFRDTARSSFWSKPEVAALLLPEGPDPARGGRVAPTSARDLASAISTAVSRLTGESHALGERARETALDLARAMAGLDGEIAALAGAVDPLEAERLVAKIAALGPPSLNEGDAKGQMRDLFQKQLDLQRGIGARLDGLKALQSRKLELLRALWFEAVDLRAAANDAGQKSRTAERIRNLCAEIAHHTSGSSATRPFADAEAVSDSPTIERT